MGGGNNANRRGNGLGGGSFGGGSGNRSGGGNGLLAILLALLIGKTAGGGNNNGGGTSRSGCLKRILILAGIVLVISYLSRSCNSSSLLSGVSLEDLLGADPTGGSTLTEVQDQTPANTASSYGDLFSALNGGTSAVSSTVETAYKAHEPDYTVSSAARSRYTPDSAKTATIMLYMCGADLESKSGMATADLQEIISATLSDNVNFIVETGGAARWQNSVVSSRTNQIYQLRSGGLKRLESNLGRKSMVEPETLSEFIRYCTGNFPADRYALIFWDHGGGSISGYGYDENFPNATMTLDEINTALQDGGAKFDFIGFDACLMATLETALVCEQYADYLVASEAVEPGTGWYYTDWVTALSENPAIATVDLAKIIIDDFVSASQQQAPQSYATLSLTDLAELDGTVPAAFRTFSTATSAMIAADGFADVANARSGARDFSASAKINQIDLIHFAQNLNTAESLSLAKALQGCVKYNRCASNISHANGLSIYFPYNSLGSVSTAVNTYNKIGLDASYTDCIRSFASMAAGGQVVSGGSENPLGTLLGDSTGSLLGSLLGADMTGYSSSSASADVMTSLLEAFLSSGRSRSVVTGDSDASWVDENLLRESVDYYAKNTGGFADLTLTDKGTHRALVMNEQQWSLVKALEMNVFLDKGDYYLDLGLDNVMDWDADDDLIMEYDRTWMSLNGQIVSYYFVSDATVDDVYTVVGRVPAILTATRSADDAALTLLDGGAAAQAGSDTVQIQTRVDIIVVFSGDDAYVAGARPVYADKNAPETKDLIEIRAGDTLDFLCDCYYKDSTFDDTYYLGEPMVATGSWVVGNAPVGDDAFMMTYRITDIYGAKYWTPTVTD